MRHFVCLTATVLTISLLRLASTPAQEKSVHPGINKRFENPNLKDWLKAFEGESREIAVHAQEIVAACKLQPSMRVADVGAGTGLFTRQFAQAIGPQGKVYAVDVAPTFLQYIEKTCREKALKNVETVLCDQFSTKLPKNSVDLVFICDTYHHFEFPQKTLRSIHEALRPGGQVILIDFHRIEGQSSEWLLGHVRAGKEVFVREITAAGFKVIGEEKFLKENYFVRFEKRAGEASSASGSEKRPTKVWCRKGPLGETPKHVTDAFPLSDQQNQGGWVKFAPMSDEFEGTELDRKKWTLGMSWWKGRQPALFSDKNVTVSDGKLHLMMRKEKVSPEYERRGYHDYTSAALHSKARSRYGYFEVKAKPMNSAGSSSFWFQQDEIPGWATEIDVFEIGGKAKGFENKYNMTLHVTRTPQEKKHWSVGGVWEAPWRLADDYHVYGLEWSKEDIKYFVDGMLVCSVENTHWHQPLFLIFDSETMPQWFGMPEDKDLPSTFCVEYVRAWKKGK